MAESKHGDQAAPKLVGPKWKWYTPHGMAYLGLRSGWRYFVTGKSVRGRLEDNATFLDDATVDHRGRPTEKLTRARWRRVARRWIVAGVPWLLVDLALVSAGVRIVDSTPAWWARIPWLWVLVGYVTIAGILGVTFAGHRIAAYLPVRAVRKTYIYPAARTLATITGVKFRKRDALAWIELPPHFGDAPDPGKEPEPVRILPPERVVLDDKAKERIAREVGARLGMDEAKGQWTVAGVERAFVELLPAGLPPKNVTLEDLMEEILATSIDRPVIGMCNARKIAHMDFKNDSPHSLGSAASGAGKSTFYKFIAMQRLAKGGYAIILDVKKWSHLRWAGRLPLGRVRIADEIPEIHDILVSLYDELMWRKSHTLAQEKELEALPVLDVYLEELGSLRGLLDDHWSALVQRAKVEARRRVRLAKDAIKDAGPDGDVDFLLAALESAEDSLAEAMSMPKKSPATEALKLGVNLGREFKIHFHFISQSVDANVAGGRNVRASFRTRFLARWDEKDWKMLAPGIPYVRCPSGEVGIWAHVHGSEYEIVRVPMVDDMAAVRFVLDGVQPSLPMFHGDPMPSIDGTSTETALPAAAPLSALVGMLPPKRGGETMSLDALRTASKRAGSTGFPDPIDREYGPNEARDYPVDHVLAWFRDRERLPMEIGR